MPELSPEEFAEVPGLELSQRAALHRFRNTRTVSVGGEVVKVSKGQRNRAREIQTEDDLKNWARVDEPGVKAEQVSRAAQRYGLMGPHDSLGRTIHRAYSREKR